MDSSLTASNYLKPLVSPLRVGLAAGGQWLAQSGLDQEVLGYNPAAVIFFFKRKVFLIKLLLGAIVSSITSVPNFPYQLVQ